MLIRRGNYAHADSEATFSVRKEAQFADNRVLIGTAWKIKVRGLKTGADPQALSTAMLAMEAAYARTDGEFLVIDNTSAQVQLFRVEGAKAVGGIRLMNFTYALSEPAELTTYVKYEIDLEANFGGVGIIGGGGGGSPQNTIVTWQESVSMRGTGGPRIVYREIRNGPPQRQLVSQRTPVFASQRGQAVGLFTWPSPPQPYWPQYMSGPDQDVQRSGANNVGGQGYSQQRREYHVSWSYQFVLPSLQAAIQLGRDFSVAEGSPDVIADYRMVTLQLGRDFSVAEG